MEHLDYTQRYTGVEAGAASDNEEMDGPGSKRKSKSVSSSRKRSPTNSNTEEDGKKVKRGRPRVDPQDQSAVEVRQS